MRPLFSSSKGQLSTPVHWIYVLVAGAIILLFFISIVVQQKNASERELSVTVSRKLDAIFTGASLSEQTVNPIDVPQLQFSFFCDSDAAAYTVGEKGSSTPVSFQPFFAPSKITTTQLVAWTLEFSMPYKVINLLFIGSPDIATYVVYDDQTSALKDEILRSVPPVFGFKAVHIRDLSTIESLDSVKLIFLVPPILSAPLKVLSDEQVHALQIDHGTVTYYRKRGDRLEKSDSAIILGSFEGKNPAFYAALFSDTTESYRCGMRKAFKRMGILADIYAERAHTIMLDYPSGHECMSRYQLLPNIFGQLKQDVSTCSTGDGCFTQMFLTANTLREKNKELQDNSCAALY